jgi:hypothetical protein
MALSGKQSYFANCVPWLIEHARQLGYAVTLGEAWRSPETCELYAKEGKGIRCSNHDLRLAIDLNVFKNGAYSTNPEDYRALGEWWKLQTPPDDAVTFCWGGDWGDFDHFSFENDGVR